MSNEDPREGRERPHGPARSGSRPGVPSPDISDDTRLHAIPAEVEPPAELHDQVVRALRGHGLVGPGVRRPAPLLRWAMTAAALLAAFVAGRVTATGPAAALPGGPGAWALLLYEDRRFDARGMTTDQMVRLYDAWATDAAERGRLLLAEKLGDEETLLVRDSSTTRAVGAGAEPGVLTGMFIVTAPTLEQALALARETPHHDLGGIVLVREIDRGAR